MKTQTLRRAARAALALLCAAALLRSVLTGLEIDEAYTLSLAHRLVSGDRLFADMWEPHQLSALSPAALLALYMANRADGETLEAYLAAHVFGAAKGRTEAPRPEDSAGFAAFLHNYTRCLAAERAAAQALT